MRSAWPNHIVVVLPLYPKLPPSDYFNHLGHEEMMVNNLFHFCHLHDWMQAFRGHSSKSSLEHGLKSGMRIE